jgi:metallo-beta-lactamase class B
MPSCVFSNIDPHDDYKVEDEIVNGLTTLGLDPIDITYVVISHGHGDHYGGARLRKEWYGAAGELKTVAASLRRSSDTTRRSKC